MWGLSDLYQKLLPCLTKRRLFILFIACCFAYKLLSIFAFKIRWTYIGWYDADFNSVPRPDEIVIVKWTRMWGEYYGKSPAILSGEECPYLKKSGGQPLTNKSRFATCRLTYDRRYLSVSRAVVFHSYDLMSEEIPRIRSVEQIWVYMQAECPMYTKLNLHDYPNVFNWTMTYRLDSDVYGSYGHVVPTHDVIDENLNNHSYYELFVKNRTLLAAWIVSSCDSHSRREDFVKELQNYISIGIYGECGMACPQGDCYAYASKFYKFYLSFENSLCRDYITEKFFEALKHDMVPVVYGGTSAEDYSKIAPNDSYIDTRNFKTAKDLAEYLIYLDKNDEEYLKYFRWKSKYKVIESQGWCRLCQSVHEHWDIVTSKRTHKWYTDLWKWWNYETGSQLGEFVSQKVADNSNDNVGKPICQPARNFES